MYPLQHGTDLYVSVLYRKRERSMKIADHRQFTEQLSHVRQADAHHIRLRSC